MEYSVYILTNSTNTTLYIGVTNNLIRRMFEHEHELIDGFSKRYKVHKLVYFEQTADVDVAINREKQLKGWTRKKKEDLINSINPNWDDLYKTMF